MERAPFSPATPRPSRSHTDSDCAFSAPPDFQRLNVSRLVYQFGSCPLALAAPLADFRLVSCDLWHLPLKKIRHLLVPLSERSGRQIPRLHALARAAPMSGCIDSPDSPL